VRRFTLSFGTPQTTAKALAGKDTHKKRYLLAGKPHPAYAEILLVRLLHHQGWNAVWIDSYKGKFWSEMPFASEECYLPYRECRLYEKIRIANDGRRGGCWDIWAWRGNRHLFIEAKRARHDTIRAKQVRWYAVATKTVGLPERSFCVAEWDANETR
jgi:hypothetical protein